MRHVIPSRGNYLTPLPPLPDSRTRSALVAGGAGDPLLPHLLSHLDRATGVDIAVAFALESGVALQLPPQGLHPSSPGAERAPPSHPAM